MCQRKNVAKFVARTTAKLISIREAARHALFIILGSARYVRTQHVYTTHIYIKFTEVWRESEREREILGYCGGFCYD